MRPIPASSAGIAASCLNATVGVLLCLLSPLEHSRNLRPSSIINVYLLSIFLEAVIVRTLWLSSYDADIRNTFTAAFTIKAALLILETVEKQRYFVSDKDRQLSPYAKSSIYNRIFFWWVNGLLRYGYRQRLTPGDLHPLDPAMASDVLDRRFWDAWQKSKSDWSSLLSLVEH